MKLTDVKYYNGSREKICKLGLADLYLELQEILINTKIQLLEEKQANGAAEIRKAIDASFLEKENWEKISAGGIDWKKRIKYNRTFIAQVGVEVQVSS